MQFSSKVMYYILHEDIEIGSFLMMCITILHLYSFILIFTSKDLNNYEHKFIKRTIDQFSIEPYCGIVADKLFNSSVNSFKTSQTIHRQSRCMGLATQAWCQSSHKYTYFLLICFSMLHMFSWVSIQTLFSFLLLNFHFLVQIICLK